MQQWGEQPVPNSEGEGQAHGQVTAQGRMKAQGRGPILLAVGMIAALGIAAGGGWYWWDQSGKADQRAANFQAEATSSSSAAGTAGAAPSAGNGSDGNSGAGAASGAHGGSGAQGGATPECTLESLHTNGQHAEANAIVACEGNFMYAGMMGSDVVSLYRWSGQQWETVRRDGTYAQTGNTCYRQQTIDQMGVPEQVRAKLGICEKTVAANAASARGSEDNSGGGSGGAGDGAGDGGAGTSGDRGGRYVTTAGLGEQRPFEIASPACDGRNILIMRSVHAAGNNRGAIQSKLGMALNQVHGTQFTYPGQCPSLRAQINGEDIYPVYYDFGSDRQAMCQMKASSGGNGRTLNTAGDFTDPC
ncbi:hypothetical protein [Corynebacterium heidelbergense]|uniref:Uncharacterized protein n=1 Tax=Corynebacterium heidelbergense TaxID=2055947 RepID=A0A364VAT0_9CORY|nr:hypothetical protein [Corynebacterium heidelbergense]RAV33752.1 hypothetical protein CWC39_06840 [Corynebacterium heidelbergense]WCZ35706.1 hypothetical protein CHEID_00635 [Corynebacterium heidelbergense]